MLYQTYHEVLTAVSTPGELLPAALISGRPGDYVSLTLQGQPLLLLSCAALSGMRRPPIRLKYLAVEFGVQYRVRTSADTVEGNFVLISLCGDDLAFAEPFCLAGDALLAALPERPLASDIERVVRQFVDLLSALSLPPGRAIAGLWAELWLMYMAHDRHAAIVAWHADPTDRFDFSYPGYFVEVKATEREERVHEFSYEQLRRSNLPISVVSLRLRRSQNGTSVVELLEMLQTGLNPESRTKLLRNVFGAIGNSIGEASEIRFDDAFANDNLLTIQAEKVPAVVIPAGFPISAVRFRVNFDDSSLTPDLHRPSANRALLI